MRAPFRLRTGLGDSGKTWDGLLDVDLGAGVRGDEVSQAPGECGVPLVYTAPALADHAVQLVSVDEARACSFGSADIWSCGRDVCWVTCGRVSQHERVRVKPGNVCRLLRRLHC